MKLAILLVLVAVAASHARKLPDFITVCKRSDPAFDTCLKNSIEKVRPHIAKGIPKIHLPAVEPFLIPELVVNRELEAITVNAKLTNVKVDGGSNLVINEIKTDIAKLMGVVKVTLPKLTVTSEYDVKGRLLAVPLNGKGNMVGEFTDTTSDITISLQEVDRKGKKYFEISNLKSKIRVGGGKIKLTDSDKSNQVTADTAMTFFNKNTRQCLDIMKPIIDDTAESVIISIITQILDVVPADELLPSN